MLRSTLNLVILVKAVVLIKGAGKDNEPSLPSRLPSPKRPSGAPVAPQSLDQQRPPQAFPFNAENGNFNGNGFGNGNFGFNGNGNNNQFAGTGTGFNGDGFVPGSILPQPPLQNTPGTSFTGPDIPPPLPPVPFGLEHIILILVPQFKTGFPNIPSWLGASCKVSLPVTVFFDKLKVPPTLPHEAYPPNKPYHGPLYPGGHFVKKRSIEDALGRNLHLKNTPSPSARDHGTKNSHHEKKSGESFALDEALLRAERVTLIPKLEKLLETLGLGGRSCLLRAICEIHEYPLEQHGYGLLGEVFTLFFSISRSAFAESHLKDYLKAEEVGRTGDCKSYFKKCPNSLFYWERVTHEGSDMDVEDEFDILSHLLF